MFGRNRNSEMSTSTGDGSSLPDSGSREELLRKAVDSYSLLSDGSYLLTTTHRAGSVPLFPENGGQHERNFLTVHNGSTHVFVTRGGSNNGEWQQGFYHYTISPADQNQKRQVTVSDFEPCSDAQGSFLQVPKGGYIKEFWSDGGVLNTLGADEYEEVARINEEVAEMTADQRNEMHMVAVAMDTLGGSWSSTGHLRSAA